MWNTIRCGGNTNGTTHDEYFLVTRKNNDSRQLWVPPPISEFKKSRNEDLATFVTSTAKVTLGIFDGRLCSCGCFHVSGLDRLRDFVPKSGKNAIYFCQMTSENKSDKMTYRLDSYGSCSSSGATYFGAMLCPSLATSNRTRFVPF